ncbi:hypothetical protein V6N12_001490 [Hibiscus sabdariffa]|uniref:Uncharacterized protein n=1 Tax=Hibiscus sabdariffa TaxID=183260 RepID=A0ABR2BR76_9ROSI
MDEIFPSWIGSDGQIDPRNSLWQGNKGSTKGLGEYVGQTKEDLQKFQGNENGVGRIGQRMRPKPRGASTLLRSSNGGSNWG